MTARQARRGTAGLDIAEFAALILAAGQELA